MSHSRVSYGAHAWLSGLSGMSAGGWGPAGGHQGRPPVSSVLKGAIRGRSKVDRELEKFLADLRTDMKKIERQICVSASAKRGNFLSRARSHKKFCVCGRKNFGNFVRGSFFQFRGRGSGGAKCPVWPRASREFSESRTQIWEKILAVRQKNFGSSRKKFGRPRKILANFGNFGTFWKFLKIFAILKSFTLEFLFH